MESFSEKAETQGGEDDDDHGEQEQCNQDVFLPLRDLKSEQERKGNDHYWSVPVSAFCIQTLGLLTENVGEKVY